MDDAILDIVQRDDGFWVVDARTGAVIAGPFVTLDDTYSQFEGND